MNFQTQTRKQQMSVSDSGLQMNLTETEECFIRLLGIMDRNEL